MSKSSLEFDFLAKIVVFGEVGVGKTCMWYRICDNEYRPNYLSTIGMDFKLKTLEVDGKRGRIQIWDSSSQERFRPFIRTYLRGALGVILYYAIDNRESFEKVGYWMEEVRSNANEKDVCIVLVGNKSDLSGQRVVSFDEGKKLAESFGIKFFEASAKANLNVDEMFVTLVKDITHVMANRKNQSKNLSPNPQRKTKCFS